MRPQATWTAFLLMCFALVGLTGLFASFAVTVPLERTVSRLDVLSQVLAEDRMAAKPARPVTLRQMLGPDVGPRVLDGPGALPDRVEAQRLVVMQEGEREARSVIYRIRLLVVVVTLVAGLVGAGIMALSARANDRTNNTA